MEVRVGHHDTCGGVRCRCRLRVGRLPPGIALEAIRLRGEDITDAVLPTGRADQSLADVEVVLTSRITEISGVVDDGRGHPVEGAAVVVFPANAGLRYPASRFLASAAADHQGRYRFEALPPADYYVAAVERSRVNVARSKGCP